MLVAGASLGLIAPIGAQASEFNIEDMNSYSRSKSSSKKLKKISSKTFSTEVATVEENVIPETPNYSFEAGSFSDTTTLDGKVVMALAAAGHTDNTYSNNNEALKFQYVWQGNLKTSFTGDDELYVRLKTGPQAISP